MPLTSKRRRLSAASICHGSHGSERPRYCFAPQGERSARAEARRAGVVVNLELARVAGPVDGAVGGGTVPDDVLAELARDLERHRPGADVVPRVGVGDAIRELVGRADPGAGLGLDRLEDTARVLARRHRAEVMDAALVDQRRARCADQVHERRRAEALRDRARDSKGVDDRRLASLGLKRPLGGFARLKGGDVPGQRLTEELRRLADDERHLVRPGVVMAGNQPGQLVLADERHRHRGGDTHVAQVLDVNRRDAAQDGEAEIERPAALRIERRYERRRLVVDVRNDPQPVQRVQPPRLRRDVGGGIVQAEERFETGGPRFGDDLAVPVAIEAVDHHAVEAGQRPHFGGSDVVQLLQVAGGLELPQAGAHSWMEADERGLPRLELDDHHAFGAAAVDDAVELRAAARLDRQGIHVAGETRVRGVDQAQPGFRREEALDRDAEQLVHLDAEDRRSVGARLREDQALAAAGEQDAVRLNRTGDMDRFALAVAEVDRLAGLHSTPSRENAASKLANICRAAATAACRSPAAAFAPKALSRRTKSSHDGPAASAGRRYVRLPAECSDRARASER